MLIAQITDTHLITNGSGSEQRLADFRAVIDALNALDPQPDAIIHTGDITHHGTAEEYAVAAQILDMAKAPVYVLAGNKDNRANLRAAFAHKGYLSEEAEFIAYAVEHLPVHLVMLDTTNPNSKKGDFCADRFAQLGKLMQTTTPKPMAVFMHHPPFEVFVGPERLHFDDTDVSDMLIAEITGQPRVLGVFCGHVHRPTTGTIGPVPTVIATAVATELRYGEYPKDAADRPIYLLHTFDHDAGFHTETRIA